MTGLTLGYGKHPDVPGCSREVKNCCFLGESGFDVSNVRRWNGSEDVKGEPRVGSGPTWPRNSVEEK